MKVYVDADACPVTDEVLHIARRRGLHVVLVCDYRKALPAGPGVEVVSAEGPSDAADWAIASRADAGDVVITADYGLAALVLAKGCLALSPRGREYTEGNIDMLLAQRQAHLRIRRGGGRHKRPPAFTNDDRARFIRALTDLLDRTERKEAA